MSMQRKKINVAVIGAGFGGLATAALLAKEGVKVTVFEKNKGLGGRAGSLKSNGFIFDMGPSWFLIPEVFNKFFAEFGKKTSHLLKLRKLDPQYRVFYNDGSFIDITGEIKKDQSTFEKYEKGAGQSLKYYLDESKIKYELAMKSLLYKNIDSVIDILDLNLLRHLHKVNLINNMHSHVSSYFKNKKLQKLLEFNLIFLGNSPNNAPAFFSILAHTTFNLGVYYPKGGIHSVIKALEKLGKDLGVEYKYDHPIDRIVTDNGRVVSITSKGRKYKFDVIVSNADYKHTEDLLNNQDLRVYDEK